MPDLKDTILDNVLCYISSARNTLTHENVIKNAMAFYKREIIIKSKEVISNLAGVRPANRKACKSHSNPASADLEDIMSIFDKQNDGSLVLPDFVSSGYMSMPPSAEFESLASVMCSMRDEVAALRFHLEEVQKTSEKDLKALDNVGCIFQDVSEIKKLLMDLNVKTGERMTRYTPTVPENLEPSPSLPSVQTGEDNVDTIVNDNQNNNTAQRSFSAAVQSHVTTNQTSNATNSSNSGPWIEVNNRQRNRQNRTSNSQRNSPNVQGANFSNNVQHAPRNTGRAARSGGRQTTRRGNISGTRTTAAGLSTVPRILDVFLGGCSLDTDSNDIIEYCKAGNIEPRKCESLPSRSEWYKCFKISVLAQDREKLLESDFWPSGSFVGKYYKPKSANGLDNYNL